MQAAALEDPASIDLEGGYSLIRTGDEAKQLRLRLERPARLGQIIMGGLGAVTAAAGIAAWITNAQVIGLALGIFGAVLIALALVQRVLLRRDAQNAADQVVLREDGVELFLHNGEVRGLSWTDADLALNLISRKTPPPASREYLLVWMLDSKIPSIELSADGFERLKSAAEAHHLLVSITRRGRGDAPTQWVEIRQEESSLNETLIPTAKAARQEE